MAWVEKHGRTWRVRYWKPDNTAGSIPGFTTEDDARDHAATLDDHRTPATIAPQFLAPHATPAVAPEPAPAAGLTLAEWMTGWWHTIDVGDNTLFGYQGLARNHLIPRWGTTELTAITSADVAIWTRQLAQRYSPATVTAIR
ncbi:hypothetical protein ABIA33_007340, partial [Streptacidiphilus sp. MAP12-16]